MPKVEIPMKQAIVQLIVNNITKTNIATQIGSLPLAIGRLHFTGCFLSFSLSIISFIMYTTDDIRQKDTKARILLKSKSVLNKFFENNNGINTIIFFK